MNTFIISLDFELLWGVRDSHGKEYHQQILNVHQVIPDLLSLFEKYGIACTWATVGALLSENKETFMQIKPVLEPTYDNISFSPYPDLKQIFELDGELIFAPLLVKQIIATPNQELASHTFCHYYCLEKGQSLDEFELDLESNSIVAANYDVVFKSFVFPRNQFNEKYLRACANEGLISYRGNPSHWAYHIEPGSIQNIIRRAFRLVDAYLPLSGSLRQQPKQDETSGMVNVPASLFLRPWSERFALLEFLRLWRIKWSMTQTAKKGGIFHLWWHPHNFGANTQQNLQFLEKILVHYKHLNDQYDFQSSNMTEIALLVKSN